MLKKYKRSVLAMSLLLISLSMVVLLGSTFGFFSYTKEGKVVNYVTISGLSVDILNEEDDALNLINTYPMYDHEGLTQKAFTFTITNKSNKAIDYTLLVENDTLKQAECVLEDNVTPCTTLSTSNIRYSYKLNNRDYSEPANLGGNNNVLFSNTIQGNTTVTVSVKLWIKHDATNDIQGQVFYGKLILQGDKSTNSTTFANLDDILDTFTVDDEEAIMCDNTNNTLSNCSLYDTIEQAIASRNTGAIVLLNDITRNAPINIETGKNITIDLNGKNMKTENPNDPNESDTTYSTDYHVFVVSGNLKINATGGGSLESYISSEAVFVNTTGNLVINGGSYTGRRGVNSYGNTTINNGTFIDKGVVNGTINNTGTKTFTINGGTFISTASNAIWNNSTGTINIVQTTTPIYISSTAQEYKPAIRNYANGTINITASRANTCTANATDTTSGLCVYAVGDGNNTGNSGNAAVQNSDAGTINVNGGTYIGGHQGFNNDKVNGSISLYDISVTAGKPLYLNNGGSINVCSSNVTSTITPTSQDLTFNKNAGTISYSSNVVFTNGTNTPTTSGTGTASNTGNSCSVSYEAVICDDNNDTLSNCMIYNTIDAAIASRNTGTITLMKDLTRTTTIEFADTKSMTLVMNGKKITSSGAVTCITNRGTLTVIGDSNSEIEAIGSGMSIVNYGPTMNINGGTYSTAQGHGIMNNSAGTMNLNSVRVIALKDNPNTTYHYGVVNYSTGTMNITGDTYIENRGTAAWTLFGVIQSSPAGTINIIGENATFDENHNYVSGIYIKSRGAGVNVAGAGTVNVNGVTVETSYNAAVCATASTTTAGSMNVIKGVFKSPNMVVANLGEAKINITGGAFEGNIGSSNQSTGSINICGGTFTTTTADLENQSTGAINYSNDVVFTSGNNTPTISGSSDNITNTGNACGFVHVKMCDSNNGTLTNCGYYQSIDLALASRNSGTLVLTKNVTLDAPITIASGKNYTFDLNGKTLTYNTANSYAIQSEGTLNLIGNGGTINGDAGAILSSGNSRLNIDGGTYGVIKLIDSAVGNFENSTHNYYADHSACDSRICVVNNSSLVANNITSTATSNKTLAAGNTATVLIKDSTLSSYSTLYTTSTDTVTIEDCTVSASNDGYVFRNNGAGTLNVKNTTISDTSTAIAIRNELAGTINLEGVTLINPTVDASGVRNYGSGTINIRDCDIQVKGNNVYTSNVAGGTGTVNIYNTRLINTGTQQCVDVNGPGTVNVYSGVFIANVDVLLNKSDGSKGMGTLNIIQTDKPIYVKSLAQINDPAIYNHGAGVVNISARQIANACTDNPNDTTRGLCVYADGDGNYSRDTGNTAVTTDSSGTTNIDGGTYYGGYRGIYLNGSGTINVSNAYITSRHIGLFASDVSTGGINVCGSSIQTIPVTGASEYDIYNNSSNGALIKYTGCSFSNGSSVLNKKREAVSGSILNPNTCPIQ